MTPDQGVLEAERQRQQFWTDLGLPDPITVLHEERATRALARHSTWTHPRRSELDAYFAENPDRRPRAW